MRITLRIIGVVLSIFLILGIILWGVNKWTQGKVQFFLDEKVQEGILKYESVSVNIFTNQFSIQKPKWTDTDTKGQPKIISLDQLKISDVSYRKFIFNKSILIGNVQVYRPVVTLYPSGKDTLTQVDNKEDKVKLNGLIIKNVEVSNGSLEYFKKDTSELTLSCNLLHLSLENIIVDSNTLKQPIPFHYGEHSISGTSFFYRMNKLYDLEAKTFELEKNAVTLDSLRIKPRYNKYQFQTQIPHEKAWVDLSVPRTQILNTEWKLNQDSLAFSASKIILSAADLYLYKDNRLRDNPYFKPLYSKLVRDLPLKVNVDSISVQDAAITFQLRTKKEPPPGLVYFQDVNGTIAHVTNIGMKESGFPRTTVRADALFMKESKIHLDWSFDISNRVDEFKVSGKLSRISEQGINYFLTPAMNVAAEGAINELAFNFAGNNNVAFGDMYIHYDALRIHLLKKDGRRRRRWISAILNFILRNKLDGPIEKKGIEVKRDQTKSFWNFLWEMVKDGSIKSITK